MKKTYLISALMLTALAGSLAAKTLVTVNGTPIDSKTIDEQVKMLRSQNKQIQDTPMLRRDLTERQVMLTLTNQEAKHLKLDQSAEYKQALEQSRAAAKQQGADKHPQFKQQWAAYESELLHQAFIAHVVRSNPVQENDAKAAYDDYSKFYKDSQEIQMGEIITRSSGDAQKAIDALKAKQSFKTVASRYTIDPQGKQNGGIAPIYVNLKDLEANAPALYTAVKDLNKGGYTQPIQSGDGLFGIFYVNDKRAFNVPSYETAKNNLMQDLQAARVDAAIQALYQKAKIQNAK